MQIKSNIEHMVNGNALVSAKVKTSKERRALRVARRIFGFVPTVKHKFSVTDKGGDGSVYVAIKTPHGYSALLRNRKGKKIVEDNGSSARLLSTHLPAGKYSVVFTQLAN